MEQMETNVDYDNVIFKYYSHSEKVNDFKVLQNFRNLKVLSLPYHNNISSLDGIQNLTKLEIFICGRNDINSIVELRELINLKCLEIPHNLLVSLEGIENLLRLTSLYCGYNRLISLDPLKKLENLQILNCDGNMLRSLQGIQHLKNLKYLICSYNYIESFSELENLSNLESLTISHNHISSLEGLKYLSQLKFLDVDSNKITSLEGLQYLSNLQTLCISHNQIGSLEGLKHLSQLEELECQNTKIISLEGLQYLSNLSVLYCYSNQIKSLEQLKNLSNLRVLRASDNEISSLEPLQNLQNLTTVTCRENLLTSVKGLENLSHLDSLDCRENDITSLNELIFSQDLEYLLFDYDKITLCPALQRRLMHSDGNVYNDSENVHDITIQKSLRDSLVELLNTTEIRYDLEQCIRSLGISKEIESYIPELDESFYGMTLREILVLVLNRICLNKDNLIELTAILKEDLEKGRTKCFTGKVTRIVNVLSGFDPAVSINISENEQINIIAQKIFQESKSVEEYNEKFEKEMQERGYSNYSAWLNI